MDSYSQKLISESERQQRVKKEREIDNNRTDVKIDPVGKCGNNKSRPDNKAYKILINIKLMLTLILMIIII